MTQQEANAIKEFPLVAQDFCQFVDQCHDSDRQHFIQGLCVRLARLCEIAVLLPRVEPAGECRESTPVEISAHRMRRKG